MISLRVIEDFITDVVWTEKLPLNLGSYPRLDHEDVDPDSSAFQGSVFFRFRPISHASSYCHCHYLRKLRTSITPSLFSTKKLKTHLFHSFLAIQTAYPHSRLCLRRVSDCFSNFSARQFLFVSVKFVYQCVLFRCRMVD